MARVGVVRDLTVLPATHVLAANGMNHAFTFSAEASPHFTAPEGWKAEST